jgi:hypothetical protein
MMKLKKKYQLTKKQDNIDEPLKPELIFKIFNL